MVSTPEGCTNNSLMTPNPYLSTKNPCAIKKLYKFTLTLDVKRNTFVSEFGAAKAKHKAIRKNNLLWSDIIKRRSHTKINQIFREALYDWILHHPQVVLSPMKTFVFMSLLMETPKQINAKVVIASFCTRTS